VRNYEAAIYHFRNALLGCVGNKGDRAVLSLTLGTTLLDRAIDYEDEVFAKFEEELDHCVGPNHKDTLANWTRMQKTEKGPIHRESSSALSFCLSSREYNYISGK